MTLEEIDLPTDADYRAQAQTQYGCDDVEVDDDATVSRSGQGAFVQAWVFVNYMEMIPDYEELSEEDQQKLEIELEAPDEGFPHERNWLKCRAAQMAALLGVEETKLLSVIEEVSGKGATP